MKKYLFCLTLLLCGAVHADDLSAGNAAFAKKAYPEAMALFTKAANAGNAEAQLHLGEMHLYGEAGKIDLVKAESWFKKSAAKGNKTAIAALEMMKKREQRKDDIVYWTSKYDGAEFKTGKNRCPAPRIPTVSKLNDEITAVAAKVQEWQTCYNNFVDTINNASPLTKLIPKDIAELLTKDEMDMATKHLDAVQSGLVEEAKVRSKLLLADYAVWRDATDAYTTQHNQMVGPKGK